MLNQNQIESLLDDVFYIICNIKDPEFPQTLEELNNIIIEWVPTVPHCHLAQQIGLSIITKLQQELMNYDDYKIDILIKQNTHQDKINLDKQINDKERVCAAQENKILMEFIDSLINSNNQY